MCSVVTNLVTSLESQPIRYATTLSHLRRTRDVYVATRIILLSSTAEGMHSLYGNTFDHLFMFLFIMSARE